MNTENLILNIQLYLKILKNFKGPFNGKPSTKFYDALAYTIQQHKISTKGWSRARLLIAGEQLLYKSLKLYADDIDGFAGPNTQYSRELYQARKATTFRQENDKLAEEKIIVPIPVKHKSKSVPSWPRQKDVTAFFGRVGTNQTTLKLPYPMVISWNQKQKIKQFSCHRKVEPHLKTIFQRTLDHYGYERIRELRLDQWGGCLNVRKMRGGSSYSMHSWGIAVDIDPDNNQLRWGRDRATLAKPVYNKFWEFVYDEGAISLGKERNYDWMHFEFTSGWKR